MRSDGYVRVQDLLAHPKYKGYTLEQIEHVVDNNDKKRYTLNEEGGVLWIRANQGHSVAVWFIEKELFLNLINLFYCLSFSLIFVIFAFLPYFFRYMNLS